MRLKVSDLRVGTEYAIQVRATAGEDVSEWSPRFKFVTVRDDTQPKVPQNVTWVTSGDSYMGEWDSVTEDIQNRPISITRYDVRFRAGAMEKIVGSSAAAETPGGRQRIDLMHKQAINMFNAVEAKSIKFSVRAVAEGPDGPIKSDWSTELTAGHDAPEPPTDGVAKGIMDGIVLTWAPSPSTDVVGYRVYVGPDANFEVTHAKLASNDPDFVWEEGMDENYIQGLEYTYYTSTYADHYFKVRAVNSYNMESTDLLIVGAPLSPFVWDETPPDVPSGVSGTMATTGDATGANISWTHAGADDLAGFWVRYRKSTDAAGTYRDMRRGEPTDRSMFLPIDEPFAAYLFEVSAYDETNNQSAWSTPVTVSGGDSIPPATPTVTTRVDQTSIDFQISGALAVDVDNGHGVWHYDISTNNTFPIGASTYSYDTGNKSLTVTGLSEGTTYYYRVKVTDAEGLQSAWRSGSTTTLDFPLPPGSTDGFVPAKVGTVSTVPGLASIAVSWPPVTTRSDAAPQPAESPINYNVYASTTSGFTPGSGNLITQAGGTSATITKVGGAAVGYGTTYYIKVIAKDADGLGAASDEVSGTSRKVVSGEVESVTAGQITTGSLASAIITMAAGGVIQSNNWVAGSAGYKLDESGLTVYNGTVAATVLKGGTISGTTINVGAGGVLNVDSTALVKSNNYAAGSTGWQLSATGLEINSGTVSAAVLKANSSFTSTLYVGSGGGIYDVNGYWSITPSSINIQNGSINAAAITSGVLRSNAYAKNADGSTNYSYYAWQVDKEGDAVFGSVYVRGRVVVDSGVMQSSYYYPGSSGWRIDSGGTVYFNQAEVNAGTFKTQASGSRLELGYSGGYYTDQVRMFNGSYVSSIRNPDNRPGTVYMSFGENSGGQMTFGTATDGNTYIQGYLSTPRLKFTSGYVQIRDGGDYGYGDFRANTVIMASGTVGGSNITSFLEHKENVTKLEGIDTASILKQNGVYSYDWKEKDSKGNTRSDHGIIADYLPDWMVDHSNKTFSLNAALGFLWESVKQSNERIEALEKKLASRS